jgi:predicted dehydrogenase
MPDGVVGVAVFGAGHWGPNLIRNFDNRERSRVLWVVDRDPGRLAQVRSRFPDVQVADTIDGALADSRVDAVVVATPTSTHYELARAALDRGKHVLVEKPIATTTAHGEALCALAEERGVVLMVGHVFLYNPGVRRVKDYIDAGELGPVHYVAMVRTNLGPVRVDVNAAWDLAAHDLSIVNYWLDAEPQTVGATGGAWINTGIEDAVFATLRYPNEVLVNLHVSWLNPRKARDITVVGERRMLTFDDMNLGEPLRIYDKQVAETRVTATYVDSFASFRASVREGDITIPRVALGEPLKAECDHFVECVARRTAPLTGGRSGVAVVRALEAMQRSMRAGGRQEEVR